MIHQEIIYNALISISATVSLWPSKGNSEDRRKHVFYLTLVPVWKAGFGSSAQTQQLKAAAKYSQRIFEAVWKYS